MHSKIRQLLAKHSANSWVEFADIIAIPLSASAGGYRCYCREGNDLQYIGKLSDVHGKVYRLSDTVWDTVTHTERWALDRGRVYHASTRYDGQGYSWSTNDPPKIRG